MIGNLNLGIFNHQRTPTSRGTLKIFRGTPYPLQNLWGNVVPPRTPSTTTLAPTAPLAENDMSRLPMAMPPALGKSAQTRRGAARPTTAPMGGGSHHTITR